MSEYNTPISLANVCDGALEQEFVETYPKVLAALKKGQKGSIKITVELERPENLDTLVNIGFKITPTFPSRKRVGIAQITDKHELKVERPTEKVTQLNILHGR